MRECLNAKLKDKTFVEPSRQPLGRLPRIVLTYSDVLKFALCPTLGSSFRGAFASAKCLLSTQEMISET